MIIRKNIFPESDNVELNTSVKGEGIPLIWAHGLRGGMSPDDNIGFFHSENLLEIAKFVRYNARGHDLSPGTFLPEDYHWSNLAKDMSGKFKFQESSQCK